MPLRVCVCNKVRACKEHVEGRLEVLYDIDRYTDGRMQRHGRFGHSRSACSQSKGHAPTRSAPVQVG